MKTSKEHFLSLKVILMQKFFKRSYFLDWAQTEGHADALEELLLTIERELRALDNEDNEDNDIFLNPSQQYDRAIESIEYDTTNFATVLTIYEKIDLILHEKLAYLQKINREFHAHFIGKLLPLKAVLLGGISSDSTFYKQISDLADWSNIQKILLELKHYFSTQPQIDGIDHLTQFILVLTEFTEDNTKDLSAFLALHPTVTLTLINYIESLEAVHKERFLFLKPILIEPPARTLEDERYFFKWLQSTEHYGTILSILSPLEDALTQLDEQYIEQACSPTDTYQRALDDLEIIPEKFSDFLTNHKAIDDILSPHVDLFKKITAEFYLYCKDRLLPLKSMLMQSTLHDSAFGTFISESNASNTVKELSSELMLYFYKEKISAPLLIAQYTHALNHMQNDSQYLIDFFKKNPSVAIILIKYFDFLDTVNQSFLKYLDSTPHHHENIDYSELVKELNNFYSEELQPLCEAKSQVNYTEEEKEESWIRLHMLKGELAQFKSNANIFFPIKIDTDFSKKDISASGERTLSEININPEIRYVKQLYRKTSIAIEESQGDRQIIIDNLEKLDSFLTAFSEIQQHLYAQFSWVKEKLPLVDCSQWIKTLNDFSNEYIRSLKKDSNFDPDNVNDPFKNTAIELQHSRGNARKILTTLGSFENVLTLRLIYLPTNETRARLLEQRLWATTIMERLRPAVKESAEKAKAFAAALKKAKENDFRPAWIQILDDFLSQYSILCEQSDIIKDYTRGFKNQEILEDTSLALFQSNGNVDLIWDALEYLEDKLHSRIACRYPSEIEHTLAPKLSWLKATLERLKSKENITHFKKIETETEKGKEEEDSTQTVYNFPQEFIQASGIFNQFNLSKQSSIEEKRKAEVDIELLSDDFERELTVSPFVFNS